MTYHENVNFTSIRKKKKGEVGGRGVGGRKNKNPKLRSYSLHFMHGGKKRSWKALKKKKVKDQIIDLEYMDAVSLFNFYLD